MLRRALSHTLIIALCAMSGAAWAQQSVHEVLSAPGQDLRDPVQRQAAVQQIDGLLSAKHQAAKTKARQLGIPERIVQRNGRVQEIADFAGNKPIYLTTHNVNAAISTGANLLQLSPYSVTGSGLTVGVWDAGAVRSTHQELTGRVTVMDGTVTLADHSTHVAGTIGASGVVANAKGMAPAIHIDSYDWNSDVAEMTGRGASYPGEVGKINLSNHSYGYVSGWNYTGIASPKFTWNGSGTTSTSFDPDFGMYNSTAIGDDSLAFNLPYYLIVRSAGNDRQDSPVAGDPVSLTTSTTSAVTYDPAIHPPGDSTYRGGYDTLGYDAVAKNVLTVGSVGDAVSGNTRSLAGAYMSYYSSWGPTDDGRVKPDVVANGETLYSTVSTGDAAYATYSGTSMASPNATGSAALVVNWWNKLCPGHVLRASTLKGLLIHTADDLGITGPDYQYGWGMINVTAAADLLQGYKNNPGTRRVVEDQITNTKTTCSYTFTWDGSSPIRATLCWTDPAGAQQSAADSRTANLVNNLNLKITGPTGTVYSPWVMPFVGDWTNAKLSAAATTGVNNTDNVERVDIASPTDAGTYTVSITYTGTLTNSAQNFSLLLSGGAATASAPAPIVSTVSPSGVTSGTTGSKTLTIAVNNLLLGANVKLTKAGQSDVVATGQEIRSDAAIVRVDVTAMATGAWNVVLTNPDGQSVTLPNAFNVAGSLWSENFESGATGWTHAAGSGFTLDTWALSTAQSRSSTHSYATAASATRNIAELYSPSIAIPAGSSNLQLTFYRYFSTSSTRDGVVLEFAVDGGAWFDVTASGSGAAFASGGYSATLTNSTNPIQGRSAWAGTSTTWTQTVINLTDNAKYPGHSLQMRWRMATNASGPGTGFYLDDLILAGAAPPANAAPSVVSSASATASPVVGTSTQLSVLGDDDGGEASLTYTWSAIGGSFDRPVGFSSNGTNSAKNTTATFTIAGTYTFNVTVRDAQGLTATSSIDVIVNQTPSSLVVTPSAPASITFGSTQAFVALVSDQFNDALSPQPTITWSSSAGSIDSVGLFSATSVGGPFTITAAVGLLSASASINVTKADASIALSNLIQVYDGSPRPITASTTPAGLATAITYNGSAVPPSDYGSYAVSATINHTNYHGSATGTLVIQGPAISTWDASHFTPEQISSGAAADTADPDHDGWDNLAEYALGADPNHATPPLLAVTTAGGVSLTFTRPKDLPDVTYAAESSTDLIHWDPVPLNVITDGPVQTVRATDPVTTGDLSKRFLRLKFTR